MAYEITQIVEFMDTGAFRTALNDMFEGAKEAIENRALLVHTHDDYVTDTELTAGLNGKVDVEAGKELSDNNYTNGEKAKVEAAHTHSTAAHAPTDAPSLATADARYLQRVAAGTTASADHLLKIMYEHGASSTTVKICVQNNAAGDSYVWVDLITPLTF